jgi:ATP-dependent protease ClpP protease subunit
MTDLAGNKIAYYAFTGVIDSNGATRIAAALNLAANSGADAAYLCLSSPGGLVADGVFLYNHMRALPIQVITHNTGTVSSIAVAVFVGAGVRYCSAHSNFMIHPTTIGPFKEGVPWMKLESSLKAALAEDQRIEQILRERATVPDNLLNDRRFRDVNINASDAVQYRIASEVREFSLPQGNQIIQI